jgi:Peptidase family M28
MARIFLAALLTAAILLLVLVAAAYGVLRYMTSVPGESHRGPLPPLTDEERTLAQRLKGHIATIAAREHNIARLAALEAAARYIEASLQSYGYSVNRQSFDVDDVTVRNIEVAIEARDMAAAPDVLVVGAHYDSARDTAGANDNASGAAAVIELARLLRDLEGQSNRRIRLVLFVNEEPPYFQTDDMGSLRYARALAERNERVVAMYSLETLGFYSSKPGSQQYPFPFGLLFPDRGDFVAFVGLPDARSLLRASIGSFRSHTAFPTIGGVAPDFVPGIDWSDHWAFAQQGVPAIMITDTAPFRYPHYHRATDTPDKVDAESLARVVKGIERMLRDMAR